MGGGVQNPSVPTGITCQKAPPVFSTKYQISWVNGATPQLGVEVWLNVNSGGYALAATVGASDTTYTANGPFIFGDVVCGKVRAISGGLVSDFSSECCVNFF